MRKPIYWYAVASEEYLPELYHGTNKAELESVCKKLADNAQKEDNIQRVIFYCGRHTSSIGAEKRAAGQWALFKLEMNRARAEKAAKAKAKKAKKVEEPAPESEANNG